MMSLPNYDKLDALEEISQTLHELATSSAYYPDKDAYQNFEDAFNNLAKTILQYQKNSIIKAHQNHADTEAKKYGEEIEAEFVNRLNIKKEVLING